MSRIYVGDNGEYLAIIAKEFDTLATLLEKDNHTVVSNNTYYTSLADLGTPELFKDVLRSADTIVYCPPPNEWSDANVPNPLKREHTMQFYTERTCLTLSGFKEVFGLEHILEPNDIDTILGLQDYRKTEEPQLWVVGDSITYGLGVRRNERYGELLSSMLDLPATIIGLPAAGIEWASDQILRSDLRKGDTLVWGLTDSHRRLFMDDESNIIHVTAGHYTRNPSFQEVLDIDNLLHFKDNAFHCIQHVYKVINFCNKVGVKLVLAGILVEDDLIAYFSRLDNYYHFNGVYNRFNKHTLPFLDLGTDDRHPGPITHKWYAEEIYKAITK